MNHLALQPFADEPVMDVLQSLDARDQGEAALVLGYYPSAYDLFALWKQIAATTALCRFAEDGTRDWAPFAVMAVVPTGLSGVGAVALLAKDHQSRRRPMTLLARRLASELPVAARAAGYRRLEVRAWADHPTAQTFIRAVGFAAECELPGLGPRGRTTFRQYGMTLGD